MVRQKEDKKTDGDCNGRPKRNIRKPQSFETVSLSSQEELQLRRALSASLQPTVEAKVKKRYRGANGCHPGPSTRSPTFSPVTSLSSSLHNVPHPLIIDATPIPLIAPSPLSSPPSPHGSSPELLLSTSCTLSPDCLLSEQKELVEATFDPGVPQAKRKQTKQIAVTFTENSTTISELACPRCLNTFKQNTLLERHITCRPRGAFCGR